ncbi:DUF1828 domain-containing protein [Aeromonas caviae]|uniref:DUF1828 domain-containing protein n=1 Tax=Aeromonas hydrophila TaxID=644 RepID=UPI00090B8C15|nr:DUF1828 domain-containing protein [Aeromonas hydrophila]APJ15124.1 hypothetical protein BOQ57_09385 [Aeromonas hydrophila]
MMCSTLLTRLGFECHPISDAMMRIISPYTYCDDGEHVGAFVQTLSDNYIKVSDRSDALLNMESRGITLDKRRIDELRALLLSQGVELNDRGEIVGFATSESQVADVMANVIRGGILASSMSLDWYKAPKEDLFKKEVIGFLRTTDLSAQLAIDEDIIGGSGHRIKVPITLKNSNMPKYLFTSRVQPSGNWNGAYSVLGRITDLKRANPELHNRYVVIDDLTIAEQFNQLATLFTDACQVLPYQKRDIWLPRLAA